MHEGYDPAKLLSESYDRPLSVEEQLALDDFVSTEPWLFEFGSFLDRLRSTMPDVSNLKTPPNDGIFLDQAKQQEIQNLIIESQFNSLPPRDSRDLVVASVLLRQKEVQFQELERVVNNWADSGHCLVDYLSEAGLVDSDSLANVESVSNDTIFNQTSQETINEKLVDLIAENGRLISAASVFRIAQVDVNETIFAANRVERVKNILAKIKSGDNQANIELAGIIHLELEYMSRRKFSRILPGKSDSTNWSHEICLRLLDQQASLDVDARRIVYLPIAETMRQFAIEVATQNQSADVDELLGDTTPVSLLALDRAISKLAQTQPDLEQLINLRYFAGLTWQQTAKILDIPIEQAQQGWAYAQALLIDALKA